MITRADNPIGQLRKTGRVDLLSMAMMVPQPLISAHQQRSRPQPVGQPVVWTLPEQGRAARCWKLSGWKKNTSQSLDFLESIGRKLIRLMAKCDMRSLAVKVLLHKNAHRIFTPKQPMFVQSLNNSSESRSAADTSMAVGSKLSSVEGQWNYKAYAGHFRWSRLSTMLDGNMDCGHNPYPWILSFWSKKPLRAFQL